jgi:hypothetical protein
MYMETSDAGGWPFYGYATNGSFRAWTYYDGTTGDWYLYNAGIRLTVPNEGGLRIGPSADYSLVIQNTTGSDGIRILDTGDDAIQIGSNPDIPNYGVYIPSPGVSTYGIWSNTSNALGEWAFYSVDNIQAGNVLAAGMTQIARVDGELPLLPGDVVAASGFAAGIPGAQDVVPLVALAAAPDRLGVIGGAAARMALVRRERRSGVRSRAWPGRRSRGLRGPDRARVMLARADYASPIEAGQRLTVSEADGTVRPLLTPLMIEAWRSAKDARGGRRGGRRRRGFRAGARLRATAARAQATTREVPQEGRPKRTAAAARGCDRGAVRRRRNGSEALWAQELDASWGTVDGGGGDSAGGVHSCAAPRVPDAERHSSPASLRWRAASGAARQNSSRTRSSRTASRAAARRPGRRRYRSAASRSASRSAPRARARSNARPRHPSRGEPSRRSVLSCPSGIPTLIGSTAARLSFDA